MIDGLKTTSEHLFLACREGSAPARVALIGAPLEATVSFRPGTRFAPRAIRSASWGLETYSPELERDLEQLAVADWGDLELAPGDVDGGLAAVEQAAGVALDRGLTPFLLGGEHLLTLGAVRAVQARFPDLTVLQFDAHADLRDDYLGVKLSHATVMRRVSELVGRGNLYQLGIRSGTAGEFAPETGKHLYPFEVLAPLRQLYHQLQGRPIYLTLDIDVVDPAFAPGTGTPEPGGVTTAELLAAVQLLAGLQVVGLDLVEVAPPTDQAQITALLAAKLVRQLLLTLFYYPTSGR